jgi:hypothetical protein
MRGQSLGHRRRAPYAAKSGTVIESPSGQGMILNRKLARHYRRVLTESVSESGIALRMLAREVILRGCARSRRVGDDRFFVALFVSQVFFVSQR